MQRTIETLLIQNTQSATLAPITIVGYCYYGVSNFLPFCELMASVLGRDLVLEDIDEPLIDQFIVYLSEGRTSATTQKCIYTRTKSVLVAMVKLGWLAPSQRLIFPKNPYPHSRRVTKGQKPISHQELSRLTKTLAKELARIKNTRKPLDSYDAAICMLAISIRTGINPTPLLELTCNCLQPHPFKTNRRLLVSFKRRGKTTQVSTLRNSDDLLLLNTVMMDVSSIIELVIERNNEIRLDMKTSRLWIVLSRGSQNIGKAIPMSDSILFTSIKSIVKKNALCNDDGKPLRINLSRLRKTFVNRIFTLSNQDPIVTAALGNHSISVSNDHYLEAPPEAEKNFSLLGEVYVNEMLSQPAQDTPAAKCKDSLWGHLAPKNGAHCTNFLACFRCKSFVVTENDLHKIFSLYWLLVAERKKIGAKRWKRFYAHIIRIIDNDIASQFERNRVDDIRSNAKIDPHPFWRTLEQLEVLIT